MRNRTERQSTPTVSSRLSKRGQESKAQSIPCITQREAFCLLRTSFGGARLNPSDRPTWEIVRGAKLNPRRNIPDSEMESPGFYGGKHWKSLTVQPVSPAANPNGRPSASHHPKCSLSFNKTRTKFWWETKPGTCDSIDEGNQQALYIPSPPALLVPFTQLKGGCFQ